MQNLNPFGQKKDINVLTKRALKPFEVDFLNDVFVKVDQVICFYETKGGNFNLVLNSKGFFVSIPKDKKTGCKPSIYGDKTHTLKYNILIE